MHFNDFLLTTLARLETATRGLRGEITERTLYEAIATELAEPEEFPVLLDWGLATGMLTEIDAVVGRRFRLDSSVVTRLRRRALDAATPDSAPIAPRKAPRTDLGR